MESNALSLPALSRAIETRDSAALRGFYAEHARLTIIDRDHPPAKPQHVVGQKAIGAYFDDVCGRAMTHRVDHAFLDADHLAFTQDCAYEDGKRVVCSTSADLLGGKIVKQTVVQAWDA